jgi:hypothetical protein
MYSVKSIPAVLLVSAGVLWISTAADGLLGGTLTEIEIVASDPPDGAIDARIPHLVDNPALPLGWDVIDLTFNGDVSDLTPSDFSITEEGGDGLAPSIAQLSILRNDTVRLIVSGPIEPGAWTVFTHNASGTSVRVGYLPGDANGDGWAAAVDLLVLVDGLNGEHSLEGWQGDIDRNGIQDEADVQTLTDLLQGNGAFDAWVGRTLPGRVPSAGSSPLILGAVIELIPTMPGPYPPGATITVEMHIRQIPPSNDIYLRMVQFDMNAADAALTLSLFAFTYDTQGVCALDPGQCGAMHWGFTGLHDGDGAVVSTVFLGMSQNTVTQMLLAGDGSLARFGTLNLTLPVIEGTYSLDALNADAPDPNNQGAQLRFGFGGADPISECTAGNGCITGGLLDLVVSGGIIDCNGNGIPDDEDISGGTSQDCNGNSIPDECDAPVCGNDCIEGGMTHPAEECDGTDDAACPGRCYPSGYALECTCGYCGDGVVGPGEDCETGQCCTGMCTFDVGTVCRPSSGPCDPAESCDGTNAACPANVVITTCIHSDGCCPTGCNAVNDNDCPSICGNGIVEPGEDCETGQCCTGTCTFDVGTVCRPSSGPCDPAESCNGTSAACPANVIITACVHGDGCCPAGCNAANDSDCPPVCGNDIIEPGEDCDGTADQACPDECQADCTCPSGQIPTVSEWGLAVMALMLLVAGKVYFRRRPICE